MKRILTLLLTLSMLISLAACGSSPSDSPRDNGDTPATATTGSGPRVVSNVDDFLAAIAPDAEILLTEGTYYLNSAKDYGKSQSPYYDWESRGTNDFALVLKADNLTIRGGGQGKTNLLTEPRTADVLTLRECRNVTLESMSLGHTVEPQACDGCVISLSSAENTALKDLDLYGCGTVGVYSSLSQGLLVQDCVIHDCAYEGITLFESTDVTIQSSTFRSLGKDTPVNDVFHIYNSNNVDISNCVITNNYVEYLLGVNTFQYDQVSEGTITFHNNQVSGNRLSGAMFSLAECKLVLDNNLFDENESRNWYATGSTHAVDMAGEEVVFEEPAAEETTPVTPGVATPVSTGTQTEVHVKTVDEFLKAIASDTCIILDGDFFDLSAAFDYSAAEKFMSSNDYGATLDGVTENYYWEYDFDGPGLVIDSVSNLTIQAEGTDRAAHVISATPRYSDVITFDNCSAITLSGFTAGHTKEPGSCAGGVILFRNCEDLLVDNCGLYGCGIIGVQANACRNLQVVNSEIYECSQSGITLIDTDTVAISGTLIRDIGSDWDPNAPFYQFRNASNVTLDGAPMDSNYEGR